MRSEGEGPSVTQVISQVQDFSAIPFPGVLKRAAERGKMVHTCCELHDKGQLDIDLFSPEIKGYLDAWLAFRHIYEPTIDSIEKTVQTDTEVPYHGRYDRLVHINGHAWLLDIKATHAVDKKTCAMQLAAYAAAEYSLIARIGVVHLKGKGWFRLIDLTEYRDVALVHFTGLLLAWYARHKYDEWKPGKKHR